LKIPLYHGALLSRFLNTKELRLTDAVISLGSHVDSAYEYMIKEYIRSNSNKKNSISKIGLIMRWI